jgi:hypothetical protein
MTSPLPICVQSYPRIIDRKVGDPGQPYGFGWRLEFVTAPYRPPWVDAAAAIPMNERLLIAIAHPKAAVPVSATYDRLSGSRSQQHHSQMLPRSSMVS